MREFKRRKCARGGKMGKDMRNGEESKEGIREGYKERKLGGYRKGRRSPWKSFMFTIKAGRKNMQISGK